MRNRAYRRHKLFSKWIRRIRFYMRDNEYKWEEGKLIPWHPTYKDCMKEHNFMYYKTTGKPCSCSMCSYYKYDRNEFKKDTEFELKNAA